MILLKPGMKRQQLVETLKDRIISGDLSQNGRLPTYEELNKQFDASRATFHYVLDQLKRDGFIMSVERQGTFIAEHLPCRNRYAIVFESDEHDNVFWTKLADEARQMGRRDKQCQFEIFHNDDVNHEEAQRLLDKLSRRMFAGVFFVHRLNRSLPQRVFRDYPDLPITALSDEYSKNVHRIKFAVETCVEKVVSCAKQQGARKIGSISRGEQEGSKHLQATAERYGLECRPEWILFSPEKYLAGVKNLVRLLFTLPPHQRPDTLYITDDNLLPLIEAALIEIGIKVPDELKLICHFNFPDKTRTVLPVKKIGYDVRDILNLNVEMVRKHYAGVFQSSGFVDGKYDSEII